MATIEVEEILTQDDSSGKIHRRFKVPGSDELVGFEGDNLDQADAYTVIENAVDADLEDLCERCFSRDQR